jgi:Tfp pilus assembly protein PilF
MRSGPSRTPAAAALALLAAAAFVIHGTTAIVAGPLAPGTDGEDVIRSNNRGAALMEQFKHTQAMEEFARVTAGAPRWAPGFVNLGLAALYARENARAMEAFQEAVRLEPGLPQGHYGLAMLLKSEGKSAEALAALEKARALDPEDGDILYNLGVLHARQRQYDAAIPELQRARQIDPNSMSIRYQLARALLQSGRRPEGEKEMAVYQKLAANPRFAVPTGNQYGEAGRYALVITDYSALGGARPAPPPIAVRFSDATAGSGIVFVHGGPGGEAGARAAAKDGGPAARAARYGSGLAIADLDGDGRPDLVFANASATKKARPALYRNAGDWKFEEITARSGLSYEGIGTAAAIADFDNDKDADLYLAGLGGGALFQNQGDGTFKDVTSKAGLAAASPGAGSGGLAMGVSWVDVDHDGDLDLFANRLPGSGSSGGSRPRLWINRGDGTFKDGGQEWKILQTPTGSVGSVFSDLDGDRDIDAALSVPGSQDQILDNRREAGFQGRGKEAGLAARGSGRGVVAGDVNGDGLTDLLFPAGAGGPARLYVNSRERRFAVKEIAVPPGSSAYGAVLFDADNDADLDLFLTGGAHLLYLNDGSGVFRDATAEAGLRDLRVRDGRGAAAADLDGDGDLDLVVTRNGGAPILLRNEGGNRNRWLEVHPRGLSSNPDGVGTKIDVQTGAVWQRREVQAGSGYLSQSPPLGHFGLRDRGVADFVRLLWPGGVLQAELDVPAGQRLETSELDRKGSSCPVLFAWNGAKHAFVTDFLGVGGLGLWVAPGVYGKPDPDEYVKIEPHQLKPREGAYHLQVVENLEEVTYLDETKLIAIDHPDGIEVYPQEQFGAKESPPHRILAIDRKERIFPTRARDHRDRDVTETILKVDRTYPDTFRLHRLAGYAEMHHLTLEFPESVTRRSGLVLFLHGWVDFEYSSSNFAAHQSGMPLVVPVLEAEGEDGAFVPVMEPMGFPAGMPRMMTVDLSSIGTLRAPRLRLRSNMRVYWDQVFLARPLDEEGMARMIKVNEIKLGGAHLHRRGFPREHSPDGREPKIYDYGILDDTQPFKVMAGDYTRFGRVTDLLLRADDQFVIFGKGEEVTLEFPVRGLPETPKRWVRSFLLYAGGYCKDMDPHTAHPETVEPLPFHGMSGYPYGDDESYPDDAEHREYRRTYNTRRLESR